MALRQVLAFGFSARAVRDRVAAGRLHRVHSGVFAVGHARLSRDGRYMAAVLACGSDSALSHRSSADKRGLRHTGRAAIEIKDVLRRTHGHRGNGTLRSILGDHAPGSTLTRNDLEEAFLAICRSNGLPQPAVNAWIALEPSGYEADFLWRSHGLIAETDGRDVHTTKRAFEHDRRRDQQLMLAGYRVVRFTRRQVFEDPSGVEATMRALLRRAV